MADKSPEELRREYDLRLIERIEKYGYTFVAVRPRDNYPEDGVGFTYTAGRARVNKPDLIASGNLPPEVAQYLLGKAAEHLDAGGSLGILDALVNVRVKLVNVTSIDMLENYALSAVRFANGGNVKIVQVLWADDKNILPGEDGYDNVKFTQQIFTPIN